ncbi:SAV_6107 family HEPN domain-containing protein [Streptomyces sp. ACA25]|uniref:SAV_6107 family HEPN domain-containing protein n=1 Tax=Streptomyces sp. ACA25 TaxID=3022596 RepID=UPI0023077D4C|nr:SAV_6107 family HEPN domain-containing protein [Streptomyces sp. ACA25]MDB1089879.1 SAV_6107 family HEPN domain-containing protein [Streptomyces sp. ACA25]
MTGLPTDVHPVLRRAPAPPAALDLLAQAERGLEEAALREDAGDAYVAVHLAALRTAAAVLAVRGRPEATARGRRSIRSVWDVLPEIAPELNEWSALFAASAVRRARVEAGVRGAVTRREADDLARAAGVFLRLVEEQLRVQPVLPRGRRET